MRATTGLLHKGFFGRSLDEFKRLSNIALKMEGIKGPRGPLAPTHARPRPLPRQHLDGAAAAPPGHPAVRVRGVADAGPPPTVFGRAVWDIDMYTYLALRVKSDGRSYFVNVQTESVVPSDLHQHRLFARRQGEWETVLVKWNDFVRTNHGFVVEPQTEMLRQKVKSIGIGLTDRVPGPFELCIQSMWATNDPNEADSHEEDSQAANAAEGKLKNKSGKNIKWSED
ncbi:hypothetical protein PG997_011083 [Apiospora hydei]|uniref:NADH:ubiquinone oxidoreductase intermediate-associated protein 30 domain-containing protein n=1 Tax=Apiospora hydei TaxID=1337664 RepID=A0ABR1VKX6_9PEZI